MELKNGSKAAFGFGAFGKDVVYMLISSYLLYYYNVVLGMDSVFIGAMMMAARVFDAFNDPIMGIIVAKTKTRWGRFRPWILAGTVLNAVTIYALYATPASVTGHAQKVWLTVFYFAWGITYTFMDIPFWSMIPAITSPGKERESLSSLARSCSSIGDAVPTVLTMVVVPILSGSSVIADYRIGFKYWALIIAIVFIISEVVFVLFVPERTDDAQMEAKGIADMFRSLFRNDQTMTIVVSIILVYSALNIVGNLMLYFFQYDVGNVSAYSGFVGVCFGTQVLIMLIFPLFRKFWGKAQLFMAGFLIQIIGFGVILLMAATGVYRTSSWMWLLIPGVMVYAGYGTLNVLLTIFLSDTVDYGEYKNGTRDESVTFSMQTFTVKLASGLAILIAGIVIDLIHLDTTAELQSAATLAGMRMWMTVPSALLLVIGMIVFKRFYKLDDAMMDQVMEKLHKESF
jgi:melibiose permease